MLHGLCPSKLPRDLMNMTFKVFHEKASSDKQNCQLCPVALFYAIIVLRFQKFRVLTILNGVLINNLDMVKH